MAGVGTNIEGKYEILRLIGEGGMSRVYLAMDTRLNKQWAVKEIKPSRNAQEQELVRASLVTEANTIKRLDHPAFPRIVDLIDDNGVLYVVMDYIEGVSLAQLLDEQGPQSQDDVIEWGKQLCDALDYLHTRSPSIIYRDMKPANIMLKPDGSVCVIDFGIAREYREERLAGEDGRPQKRDDTTMLGTKGYAAPEQFGGLGQTDARTDVYCLGATLYHLVTGQSPAEPPYVMYPVRQIDPTLSPGFEKILAKATQQNPEARYASCAEMLFELEHYDTADDAHYRKLRRTWRAFVGVSVAAVLSLAVGVGSVVAAEIARSEDYDLHLSLAEKETDQAQAAKHYMDAVKVKPERIDAYLGLIGLYKADEVFSADEESQFLQTAMPYLTQIKGDSLAYAQMAFETGRLYWYYYDYAANAGDNRLTRVKSAGRWMSDAAAVEAFDKRELAQVYSGIAQFNDSIVARINEGDDAGLYEPYFRNLQQLVSLSAESKNDVVVLQTSSLTMDALQTYARKFRADGVSQEDMEALVDEMLTNTNAVQATTSKLDSEQRSIVESEQAVRQAIKNAFTDAREV